MTLTGEVTTVFIADDHPVFLEGLRIILDRLSFVKVVGDANDGALAWHRIQESEPAVAILDLEIPELDGISIARRISRQGLNTKVVILTMHKNASLVRQALDAGALGFLVKEQAVADISKCLKAVLDGQHFVAAELSGSLLTRTKSTASKVSESIGDLTKTQREIVRLVARGMQTKEIAAELGVSYRTVENHRHRIVERLGLKGNNSLLRFALKHRNDLS